ncbi:MAG TPA: pyridoxal-phosphate dependent enzyme [Mogibacterium sp.]|nr:pyridoxal-phosphate dependent enzyme [Mogibacterium sp.]
MALGYKKLNFVDKTPLNFLPTLSRELGINLYLKRDDLTPWGGGGNKLRKLEYLVKDAINTGHTALLTVGGAQTNHGRLTAAVGAKYGLKTTIVAIDDYPGEISANILLDAIMDSNIILKKSDGREEGVQFDELCAEITGKYEKEGEKVYFIPMGGSNALGTLGYYDCALELIEQSEEFNIPDARVITAVGSMGTYMGLLMGLVNEKSSLSLTGVAISPFGEAKEKRIMEYLEEVKEKFNLDIDVKREEMDIQKDYTKGAYNNADKDVRNAVLLMARKEAVMLDPCYTGKAFAGIVEMIKENKIKQGEDVIFIHTGGFPGLYTKHHRVEFEKELQEKVKIIL